MKKEDYYKVIGRFTCKGNQMVVMKCGSSVSVVTEKEYKLIANKRRRG